MSGAADAGLVGQKRPFASPLDALVRLKTWFSTGSSLPDEVWAQRHRWILALLWVHVPAIFVFALVRDQTPQHSAAEASIVGLFALVATMGTLVPGHRRFSTVVTSMGLMAASGVLVHLSNGSIEMHFHFFVMVGVVALYQDWLPFLVAIGFVVLHHGIMGVLEPASVYNHAAAQENPWKWASIHGGFILAMSAVGVASWRLNESLQRHGQEREVKLAEALSLLTATLDSTADGILVVDLDGQIMSFNQRFVELWRIPTAILETRDDSAALGFVLSQVEDPDAFVAKVQELYAQPDALSEDTIVFLDGRIFERSSMPQRIEGKTIGRVWSFRDATERKRLENELSHQAFHDSLTGLANQVLFRDRVDHALSRTVRGPGELAVLFIDLDDFKTVNDSLGHTAGDEMLVLVADRLRACLRTSDSAARLGGDEFAVLLEDLVSEDEADRVAQRLLSALQDPFPIYGHDVVLSASIGIAFADIVTSSDQLLRNADLAMYTAKRLGKHRHETYHSEMHAAALGRLEREGALRRGLDRGELVFEYQPVVRLPSGRIVGFEALVRWQHPEHGLLQPSEFIALAEETGLIGELGRQVLAAACTQTRRWQLAHPDVTPLSISVNVSARQLQNDDLIEDVKASLAASGLPAASLVLEITETAMMHDTETTIPRLEALKALGVRLAVDDFGTGYSSLSYLQRFPVDILKIDRAFVSTLGEQSIEVSLAPAIVSLARTLHLDAVAEGIETEIQAEILAGLGCELAQGFFFSRPADVETIDELLTRRSLFPDRVAQTI